jgi:hypothetical protein
MWIACSSLLVTSALIGYVQDSKPSQSQRKEIFIVDIRAEDLAEEQSPTHDTGSASVTTD